MINKTFSKILTLGLSIVLITSVLTTFVFYKNYEQQEKKNLQSTAQIVASEMDSNDDYSYISNLNEKNIRITLIDHNGKVLSDSLEDAEKMESHADRPEFKEALETGEGSVIRKSSTVDKTTFYYAVMLGNGNVMRIASSSDSVYYAFYKALIFIAVIMLAVMLISLALSFVITKSIVKPVVELGQNLDNIDNFKTYDELQPFVDSIKKQNERKKQLDKQKKEFTANISHELKTPLTSIAGYAELIENGIAKPEDVKPFAGTIRKQALRLVSLTEDIIQLSQLDEMKNDEDAFESVELSDIAERCVQALEMNARSKNVKLIQKCAPCRVYGNPALLEEMVYNLIDNAIRYNKENGEVTVSTATNENKAFLTVEDTGIGIPKKYQSRIFERFFRVDKSRSKETGGTGLGLAIVKHIVQTHNATINLYSVEDVGTTIQIEFQK
ncbi:ATP-binding protein [uncultured Eubacterium sp.]|uniref:sensor histidine kinase n=1 Tax=uncultured Eubacterium sp. TaxID=165185 RepID=UPI001EC3965E|nr:ATP-binding protein [uncultured Eubacterium sp.]MBS5274665.1 two-component sensor histidine kinase [Clostridiales bacterium]